MRKDALPVMVVVTVLLCVVAVRLVLAFGIEQSDESDVLFYSVRTYGEGETLFRFYPVSGENAAIYHDPDGLRFKVSPDGRIAFDTESGLWLLTPDDNYETPINLGDQIGLRGTPLGWSHDGQYLALVTEQQDESLMLYIWDGQRAFNITPQTGEWKPTFYRIDWSYDGRLAIQVFSPYSAPEESPSEIYLWDGNGTTSLSQNPHGDDIDPIWNTDNELAFLSERDAKYRLLVWDGVSYQDNAPDVNSFTEIAAEATGYFSSPSWTSTGQIAFGIPAPGGQYTQIYLWDGEVATNISQNPDAHNGGQTWSSDGYWAFVTYFSPEQLIFVRDRDNNTVLETGGQYTPGVPVQPWRFAISPGAETGTGYCPYGLKPVCSKSFTVTKFMPCGKAVRRRCVQAAS